MKLKPIPESIVVQTLTESEAKELLAILHENGWTWNSGNSLLLYSNWLSESSCYNLNPDTMRVIWHNGWEEKHLTLGEFKKKYVDFDDTLTDDCKSAVKAEKPQPKFKVGDKVFKFRKYMI